MMRRVLQQLSPVLIAGAFIAVIWYGGVKFAGAISEYRVYEPAPGIKCIVVARMFNTSVDCWSRQEEN